MPVEEEGLAALARLLAAYAGRAAGRHRLIWALDARLADIVRTTSEPLIGQMRLTWWHDVITDDTGARGRGDPLVDALRANGAIGAGTQGLRALIGGWEALLEPEPLDDAVLRDFARQRGGGLFRALAGEPDEAPAWLDLAGAAWALWDLSGHVGDRATAGRALALARDELAGADAADWPAEWRAQRIAYRLARTDILAGRRAPPTLNPGLYGRLLRIALLGR